MGYAMHECGNKTTFDEFHHFNKCKCKYCTYLQMYEWIGAQIGKWLDAHPNGKKKLLVYSFIHKMGKIADSQSLSIS